MTQRMRIKVKANDHRLLDESVAKIINAVQFSGGQYFGPTPLPVEVAEQRIHQRIVDVYDPTSKIMDALYSINMPSGVSIEIVQ